MTYDPAATAKVGFDYGGVKVVDPVRTLPLKQLQYPDKVVASDPGR